jgi:hypothetical protein
VVGVLLLVVVLVLPASILRTLLVVRSTSSRLVRSTLVQTCVGSSPPPPLWSWRCCHHVRSGLLASLSVCHASIFTVVVVVVVRYTGVDVASSMKPPVKQRHRGGAMGDGYCVVGVAMSQVPRSRLLYSSSNT